MDGTKEEASQDGEGEVHGAVVGVINPPPDLRQIVDKTAMFVAKNGKKFEAKILAKNDQDVKFGFLKPTSPYHKYYQKKVDELAVEIHKQSKERSARAAEGSKEAAKHTTAIEVPPGEDKQEGNGKPLIEQSAVEKSAAADSNSVVTRAPKLKLMAKVSGKGQNRAELAPPPLTFLLEHPDSDFLTLSAARIDLIKLTARYTAALGRPFLSQLALRELSNPEFDFLKPSSGLFSYFSAFVDSYSKILEPEKRKEVTRALNVLYGDRLKVLDRCVHRVEWNQEQLKHEESKANDTAGERVAFLQIDWHDFVVVETIQFEEEKDHILDKKEDKPLDKGEAEEKANGGVDIDVDMDMDMDVDMDEASDEEKIEIRKDYKPTVKTGEERSKTVTLPDGRQIDADDVNEHVRVDLIDPGYKEQQKRHMEKKQNLPFVQKDISRNLAKMASHRPDVFPVDEELAKQAVEEEAKRIQAKRTVVWDGSTETVAEVTMKAQKKLLDKQGQEAESDSEEQLVKEPAQKKAKK